MKRRLVFELLVVCLLTAGVASPAGLATSQAFRLASAVTLPFELVTRHIVLPATVNQSRPLSFVLDTGANSVIVDLGRAKELGLSLAGEVKAGGVGSQTTTGSFVKDATLSVSGVAGFTRPVTLALPLERLARRFGHDFDGIIGTVFIKEFVVEIDYEARVIRLHDRLTFTYAGPGESIPIRLNSSGHPTIDAEVTPVDKSPIKGTFVIDVGSGGSLALHSPFVSEHRLPGADVKTIKALGVGGAGGASTGRIGRVSALKIGKFTITNPTVLFSQDTAGAFANAALEGNIGQQVMSRFRVFLDYSRARIILEPSERFGAPFDRASSGLSLTTEGADYKTFRIMDVLENSPASEAGLRPSDVITAIDGRAASELTLTTLLELFERPVSYKLTVQRGDQTLQLTLTPRQLV